MAASETLPLILVAPLGDAAGEIVQALPPLLAERFPGRGVRLVQPTLPLPEAAFDAERRRYRAASLLALLAGNVGRAERIVGLADVDIAAADAACGLTCCSGPAALVSLAPLRRPRHGRAPDRERLRARAGAAATHALAHTYGLAHCDAPACLLSAGDDAIESDRADGHLCPAHAAQLRRALGPAG